MNDLDAFLRKIRENPDDDAPRLVFADYLDEQSHCSSGKEAKEQAKWAALIRAQIAEERESTADLSLWNKWVGLDNSKDFKLAQQIVPKPFRQKLYGMSRGFYDDLGISVETLAAHSQSLLDSVAPMRRLEIDLYESDWSAIAGNPVLGLFRRLDFTYSEEISESSLEAICSDTQLQNLISLDISTMGGYEDADAFLDILKDCKNFPNLRRLQTSFEGLGEYREILQYPITSELEFFEGHDESVGCAVLQSQATLAKTLTSLSINDHEISPSKRSKWGEFSSLQKLELGVGSEIDWVTPFLKRQSWQHLTELTLSGRTLPKDVLSHFEKGDGELKLVINVPTRPQLEGILSSPIMGQVKTLRVYTDHIEYVVELLSQNEIITNLRSLEINCYEGIKKTIPFFKTLSKSPMFASLLHLESNCSFTLKGLKQLAEEEIGQSLRALICGGHNHTEKWQEFLRDTKNFPNLVHFSYVGLEFDDNLLAKGRKKLKLT